MKIPTTTPAATVGAGRRRRRRGAPRWPSLAVAMAAIATAVACSACDAVATLVSSALATDCASAPPLVVFPQSSPFQGSGPGALVSGPGPAGSACSTAGSTQSLTLTPILDSDTLGAARSLLEGVVGTDAVAGTTQGQVVAALRVRRPGGAAPAATLIEGRADGPFSAPHPLGTAAGAVASATGYLGDVALAWVQSAPGRAAPSIALAVQRHFATAPASRGRYPVGGARVDSLRVTLDYRSDTLLTWADSGRIRARYVPAAGAPRPRQTLGYSTASPPLAALVSDDGRAIVAWISQHPASGGRPATGYVYLSISGPGVRFSGPRLIERFREPSGRVLPSSALALVRLSTESVTMAWTGLGSAGHYVVRSANIGLGGPGVVTTLSDPGADALLGALAPGPRADAAAIWTVPGDGTAGAATSVVARLFAPSFKGDRLGPALTLSAPGPDGDPTLAFDPNSDRTVAAWRAGHQPSGIGHAVLDPLGPSSGPAPVS